MSTTRGKLRWHARRVPVNGVPEIPTRGELLKYEEVDGVDELLAERRGIIAKAKQGHEDSLAYLRDEFHLRTWYHRGQNLIKDGVLGVKGCR